MNADQKRVAANQREWARIFFDSYLQTAVLKFL
jgi:hypothetical protein